MVFYIIAASDKEANGQPKSEQAVEAKIKATKSFKGLQATEVYRLAIDKSQFKIGSLDQLMALNESAAKLDTIVDLACKKLEKICFDTGSTTLEYHDEIEDKKSKPHLTIFSELQGVHPKVLMERKEVQPEAVLVSTMRLSYQSKIYS